MAIVKAASVDNGERAAALQAALDIPRDLAARLGWQAVQISGDGFYSDRYGQRVDIASKIQAAKSSKKSIRPEQILLLPGGPRHEISLVTVVNETTLQAARKLQRKGRRVVALVFANGVSAGGTFLRGGRAQEEFICRSTGLHATLIGDEMYESHRRRSDYESSDWAILSEDVPVFRDDVGELLSEPWLCSFITCAAPVMSRVGPMRSAELMDSRIARVLEIAAAHGYDALVLGAWGCGAFRNDALATAAAFERHLEGATAGLFAEVVFAITDWSTDRSRIGPFRDRLASDGIGGSGLQPVTGGNTRNGTGEVSVFVSHASEDAAIAQDVARAVESLGIKAWIAIRDLVPGSNYATKIVEAIEASSLVVVLLSSHAVESQHVRREVNVAIDVNKDLLPFVLSDSSAFMAGLPAAWRYWLSIVQVVPFQGVEHAAFAVQLSLDVP